VTTYEWTRVTTAPQCTLESACGGRLIISDIVPAFLSLSAFTNHDRKVRFSYHKIEYQWIALFRSTVSAWRGGNGLNGRAWYILTNLQLDWIHTGQRASSPGCRPRSAGRASRGWTPRRCRAAGGRGGAGRDRGHHLQHWVAAALGGRACATPGARRCRRARAPPAGRRSVPPGRGTLRAAPPSTRHGAPTPPGRPSDPGRRARVDWITRGCLTAMQRRAGWLVGRLKYLASKRAASSLASLYIAPSSLV
jgi:hypothetical protein